MKNTYLFIMLLACFFVRSSKAQNLVPNPSFEQYDTCPGNLSEMYRCLNWENWLTTPDYFNVCAPCCGVSIPYNLSLVNPNFQMPHSGDAYAGYFNYWTRAHIYTWPWIRDLFGCELNQPLQIGVTYNFSMYVSLAKFLMAPCGSNKIGVKFTTQSYSTYGNQNSSPIVDNTASIYFDTLITDTTNWVLLSGTFTADSAYQYMGIGNFFDDFHTDSLIVGSFPLCYSYYLVDDVSLTASTGISSGIIKSQVKIYPNPCMEIAYLELADKKSKADIKLYDFSGRDVTVQFEIKMNDGLFKIQRNQVASGIYSVSIFQNGQYSFYKLILK